MDGDTHDDDHDVRDGPRDTKKEFLWISIDRHKKRFERCDVIHLRFDHKE